MIRHWGLFGDLWMNDLCYGLQREGAGYHEEILLYTLLQTGESHKSGECFYINYTSRDVERGEKYEKYPSARLDSSVARTAIRDCY